MKNILIVLLGSAIFLVTACKQVDQELVDKMEAQLASIKQTTPTIEAAAQKSAELVKRMTMAPNALKFNSKFNFNEVYEQANAINGKYATIQSLCSSGTFQLDSMIQNYTNGNLKRDSVAAAVQAIAASLDGVPQTVDRVNPFFEQVSANYSKMLDDWNALPESEKKAAEKALLSPTAANPSTHDAGLTPRN